MQAEDIVDGSTLTLEAVHPYKSKRNYLYHLKTNRLMNICWNCFLTDKPCYLSDVKWNPTKIFIFIPHNYHKAEFLYNDKVLPSIRKMKLNPSFIRVEIEELEELARPYNIDCVHSENFRCNDVLSNICRAGQEGLLSIVDMTDSKPLTFLSLGLLWGMGHTVILTNRYGADIPRGFRAISYQTDNFDIFTTNLIKTIQKRAGINEYEKKDCFHCHNRFESDEKVILRLDDRSLYHKDCWYRYCTTCNSTSYLYL